MTKQALSLVHDLHNDKCLWSNAAIGRMTSLPATRASLVLFSPCKAVCLCVKHSKMCYWRCLLVQELTQRPFLVPYTEDVYIS